MILNTSKAQFHTSIMKECAHSLISSDYKDPQCVYSIDEKMGQTYCHEECANTLASRDYKQPQAVTAKPIMMSDRKGHNGISDNGIGTTLTSQEKERPLIMANVVRRLTPEECELLQGFPKFYTRIGEPEEVDVNDYDCVYDDEGQVIYKRLIGTHKEIEYFYIDDNGKKKKCSDSNRYKALGNSIALPFWFYLLRRISALYERPATLGSLFDGIGGFPLCWERCNGQGTAIWASEIEEFPIAVTKVHFPEKEE